MKRMLLGGLVLLALAPLSPAAQTRGGYSVPYDLVIQQMIDQVSADSLAATIQRLEAFRSRFVLTDSSLAASAWLLQKFAALGYPAEFDSFFIDQSQWYYQGYERNVVATALGATDPGKEYILCAHLDDLVLVGDPPLLDTAQARLYAPGADNNASGMAVVLEAARLMRGRSWRPTIRYIGWTAESIGVLGSTHYAEAAQSQGADIQGVLNFCMSGYQYDDTMGCEAIYPDGNSRWLAGLLQAVQQRYLPGLSVSALCDPNQGSDQLPFAQRGYPGFLAIERRFMQNPHLWDTTDVFATLTPAMYTTMAKAAVAALAVLGMAPYMVQNVAAAPGGDSTSLSVTWTPSTEVSVSGYTVWWGRRSGEYTDSLPVPGRLSSEITITGLMRDTTYYIAVRAVNPQGYQSPRASEVDAMPVHFALNQGILVVDETNNWTSGNFPLDAQQDSFYEYLLTGYQHQKYDFGGIAQKPALADLALYSTVVWHSDDPSQFLAYNDTAALRQYLSAGGRLWLTGWKVTGDIRCSASYPADFAAGSLLYDCFKICRAELSGSTDSFKTAIGLRGYPDISVDTTKYPATIWGKVLRNMEAYVPAGSADTIYVMDMKNNGSAFEGRACAVRDSGRMVLFGFPLYYMNRDQARLAAQKVMAEFGEPYGVSGKPESRISKYELRLEQSRPNPFKQSTTINYQIPKPGMVNLSVYNIAGQRIRTLVNEAMPAGSHQMKWDGQDDSKRSLSAGIYFVRLNAGGRIQTRKLMLVR